MLKYNNGSHFINLFADSELQHRKVLSTVPGLCKYPFHVYYSWGDEGVKNLAADLTQPSCLPYLNKVALLAFSIHITFIKDQT